jgi:uncharacterized protein (DUF1697 family)
MNALREVYAALNFKNIETYIQSGNVVFQSGASDVHELENKISKKLLKIFSAQIPVLVLELGELKKIVKNNPFVNKRTEDPKALLVTFLSDAPNKEDLTSIQDKTYAPDEFIVSGKTVYLFCPKGYGNTKLTNTFFEKKLKVMATARNWKTVLELVNMAERTSKVPH